MDVKLGAEQPDDAVGGECNDAEHQVAERLQVAANAEMAATEFIFDASIGAFCGGRFVVCQVPGIGDFDQPAPCALGGDFRLERGVAAGVAVDHRNPAGGEAIIDDRVSVVCGIHEVVELHDALFAGPGERDGDLAVMDGSGGEDRGDGDDAVGGIKMQLVADPGFPEPLAVAFDTDITLGWQPGAHLVERLRALLLDAGQRLGWRYFMLAQTAMLALGRRRRRRVIRRPAAGFLAGFDLRGIGRDMTDDVILPMTADELLMHTFRQTLCGELDKGAREGLEEADLTKASLLSGCSDRLREAMPDRTATSIC